MFKPTMSNEDMDVDDVGSVNAPSEQTFNATTTDGEDKSGSTLLAGSETRQIGHLRNFVFGFMLLAAAGVAFGIFRIIRGSEQDNFDNQYTSMSIKIHDTFQANVARKVGAVDSLSIAFTSYAKLKNLTWPMVSIPDFHLQAANARALAEAVSVSFFPLVKNETRELWEAYASENSGWIDEELDFEEAVAGRAERSLEGSNLDVEENDVYIDSSDSSDRIFNIKEENHKKVVSTGTGPFFPLWQSSPAVPELVNFDLISSPQFMGGIEAMLESKQAVIGKVSDLSVPNDVFQAFETHWVSGDTYDSDPVSKLYFPVFNRLQKEGQEIVGMLTAVFFWETYMQDVFPPNSPPLIAVVENNCGQIYTYQVEGPHATYLGAGDIHDSEFKDMMEISTLFESFSLDESINKYQGVSIKDLCAFTLHTFPTQEMKRENLTLRPWIFASVIAGIFLFAMVMIWCYDFHVMRRQELVMTNLKQSGAIVSSIFPAAVRARLFKDDTDHSGESDKIAPQNKGSTMTQAQKLKIKSFLNDAEVSKRAADSPDKSFAQEILSKPIADTFPEATILFASIYGFTAWSSEREPQQVFMLLQTLYHAFDRIAKRVGVFKVETIGDCYVAATGLPEPQNDHAVRMAKFARLSMIRMRELTSQMEVTLGPDTGDLRMRVGMHSGSVLAGVLRGEKSRFQIFGDTVNMASRMESNGQQNRIHCSECTSERLAQAGRSHWMSLRKEMVKAKGKGWVKTFWVNPRSEATTSENFSEDYYGDIHILGSETASDEQNVSPFVAEEKVVAALSVQSSRQQRLVDWNVELLTGLLKQVEAHRRNNNGATKYASSNTARLRFQEGATALDELTEIITLPKFDRKSDKKTRARSIELSPVVRGELRDYVTTIASMYHSNDFHNFEHASHVTQSTSKLLNRIVLADNQFSEEDVGEKVTASELHDYSHGLATDPLTQFALIFCALIHDVDHPGVSNFQLIAENTILAKFYKNKSIAEQNSVDLAWDLLMDPQYSNLQKAIYGDKSELQRFRQLIVNIVLATDIFDKDMKSIRERRWEKAFQYGKEDEAPARQNKSDIHPLSKLDGSNLKATVVLEHLIQASDVSHTMQHWDIFIKWNERLFFEMYSAYDGGRSAKDPSHSWFESEIFFFDRYIIPLAKKLDECGVFGVSSDEYLNYARSNRKQWASKGDQMVAEFLRKYKERKRETEKPTCMMMKAKRRRSSSGF